MNPRLLGYALVAAAALGWGTWPLILKWAARGGALAPASQSAIVMVVLTAGSGVAMVKDRVRAKATAREWLGVAWLGVADAANVLFFFAAYQMTSVAIAVLTHYLAPIFVALAAPLVARERPRATVYVAVAIAFGGLVVLLAPWSARLGPRDALGAACGAASAVFYASNVLVNKRLAHAFSGSELMFYHGFVALPALLLVAPRGELAHVSSATLGPLLVGAAGPGVVGGLLFVWGLRRVPATHASILTLLEPFGAVVIAALALGEPIGMAALVGGALVLGGAALVMRPPRPGPSSDAEAAKRAE
ncbi:MAG: DMT family transporter [Myxococcales bacterium]|nr:DMT family transporter [Myxococcales bacterium]